MNATTSRISWMAARGADEERAAGTCTRPATRGLLARALGAAGDHRAADHAEDAGERGGRANRGMEWPGT